MEYHCNKDQNVAIKIFELGLKAFPDDIAFAVKFLQFLIQLNDESSKYRHSRPCLHFFTNLLLKRRKSFV
jgi:hypothetical protein